MHEFKHALILPVKKAWLKWEQLIQSLFGTNPQDIPNIELTVLGRANAHLGGLMKGIGGNHHVFATCSVFHSAQGATTEKMAEISQLKGATSTQTLSQKQQVSLEKLEASHQKSILLMERSQRWLIAFYNLGQSPSNFT